MKKKQKNKRFSTTKSKEYQTGGEVCFECGGTYENGGEIPVYQVGGVQIPTGMYQNQFGVISADDPNLFPKNTAQPSVSSGWMPQIGVFGAPGSIQGTGITGFGQAPTTAAKTPTSASTGVQPVSSITPRPAATNVQTTTASPTPTTANSTPTVASVNTITPAGMSEAFSTTPTAAPNFAQEMKNRAGYNEPTTSTNTTAEGFNLNHRDPYQFFNPYVGVDLAQGAHYLGTQVADGNVGGIAVGAAKTGLGLGRAFMGGLGQEKAKQRAMKTYYDNQYSNISGAKTQQFFQEGGEMPAQSDVMEQTILDLKSGKSPQDLAVELQQQGVPAEQVQQIIQAALQQMNTIPQFDQGGEEGYYQDGGTQLQQVNVPNLTPRQQQILAEQKARDDAREAKRQQTLALRSGNAAQIKAIEDAKIGVVQAKADLRDQAYARQSNLGVKANQLVSTPEEVAARNALAKQQEDIMIAQDMKKSGKSRDQVIAQRAADAEAGKAYGLTVKSREGFQPTMGYSPNTMKEAMAAESGVEQKGIEEGTTCKTGVESRKKGYMSSQANEKGKLSGTGQNAPMRQDGGYIFDNPYPTFNEPFHTYQDGGECFECGGQYQEGGEIPVEQAMPQAAPQEQAIDPQQIMQQVAEALQQGADPQQIMQQMLSMGIPEEQATQIINQVMQQLGGGQQAPAEAPMEEQPMMKSGGEFMSMLKGKTIKDYKYNPETGEYDVQYE